MEMKLRRRELEKRKPFSEAVFLLDAQRRKDCFEGPQIRGTGERIDVRQAITE